LKSQRAYVTHALECIGRITADSASGRDAVFGSHTLQDAIVRNIQVLCESVRRIDPAYKNLHADIDWKAIAVCETCQVHDYFDIDFEAIWDVITRDLPPLEFVMRSTLAQMDIEGVMLAGSPATSAGSDVKLRAERKLGRSAEALAPQRPRGVFMRFGGPSGHGPP
jgi:uncharacterized protein with HEPN domain